MQWEMIGTDLRREGYGPTRVAILLGRPRTSVYHWMGGTREPGYTDGYRLLCLWARIVAGERISERFTVHVTCRTANRNRPVEDARPNKNGLTVNAMELS